MSYNISFVEFIDFLWCQISRGVCQCQYIHPATYATCSFYCALKIHTFNLAANPILYNHVAYEVFGDSSSMTEDAECG